MRVRDLLARLAGAGAVYAAVLAATFLCVGLALIGPLGVLDPKVIVSALAIGLPGAVLSVGALVLMGLFTHTPWIASAMLAGVVSGLAGAAGVLGRIDMTPGTDAFFDATGLVIAGAFVTFGLVGFIAGAIVARRGGEGLQPRSSAQHRPAS